MEARIPHESFLVCCTKAEKGHIMTRRDSQVLREMNRRCRQVVRELHRPRPCKRCGARTRTADRHPCRKWAMANGRCALHGGKSLMGIASPRFRHGRYSKLLVVMNLEEKYYRLHPEARPRPRARHGE